MEFNFDESSGFHKGPVTGRFADILSEAGIAIIDIYKYPRWGISLYYRLILEKDSSEVSKEFRVAESKTLEEMLERQALEAIKDFEHLKGEANIKRSNICNICMS